uniref:Uncharacterized protein n=1 Tax=Monodon monoceros TaxID=40151 RepID=A0A8C6F4W7_MONMO
MNSLLVNELCCLFCCPPCPGLITVKLTFLPPGPTYSLVPEPEPRLGGPGPPLREPWPAAPRALEAPPAGARQLLYSQRKLDTIEVLATKSSWVIHVSCMYLCCVPSASFCIGLGTRIKCNISSNYFGYRVSLGKPLEKNLYADSASSARWPPWTWPCATTAPWWCFTSRLPRPCALPSMTPRRPTAVTRSPAPRRCPKTLCVFIPVLTY